MPLEIIVGGVMGRVVLAIRVMLVRVAVPMEFLARPGGNAVAIRVQAATVRVHVRLLMQVAVIIQSAVQIIVMGMGNVSVQTQAVIAIRTVIVAARARVTGRLRSVLRVAAVHVRLLMQVAVIIQSAVQMIVVGMGNVSVQTQAVIAIRTVIVAARARVTGRLRSVLPAVVVAAAVGPRARKKTNHVRLLPNAVRTIA